MYQISFYVPEADLEIVKNAMFDAGAGQFDNYEQCAWQTIGMGQFKPINEAQPANWTAGRTRSHRRIQS